MVCSVHSKTALTTPYGALQMLEELGGKQWTANIFHKFQRYLCHDEFGCGLVVVLNPVEVA